MESALIGMNIFAIVFRKDYSNTPKLHPKCLKNPKINQSLNLNVSKADFLFLNL